MRPIARQIILFISCVFISGEALVAQVAAPSNTTSSINNDKNWIISRSFDETGKVITERKQFFDNSGRLLQQQNKVGYRRNGETVFSHVFATQPLRDALGREAASTLAAPIDYGDFNYKPDFIKNTNGGIYDYTNFDRSLSGSTEVDKTNNPDPVGGQSSKGTLGWYYGTSNTWEPYTPVTNYPYGRSAYYRDGTGEIKSTASAGEPFKAGSGHEARAYSWPVINELDNYLSVRSRFFTAAELGEAAVTMKTQAKIVANRNADGREVLSILDKDDKVLVTGRPSNASSSGLTVTNTVSLVPNGYRYTFPKGDFYGGFTNEVKIVGDGHVWVSTSTDNVNYTQVFSGHNSAYTPPAQFTQYLRVESDRPFWAHYRMQNSEGTISVTNPGEPATVLNPKTNGIHYFKLFGATPVTITGGSYKLYDMGGVNEAEVTGFVSGNSLAVGYYKLVATNKESVTLTYSTILTDLAYNFYNQLGQLTASLAPEGVKQLLNPASGANCPVNYAPLLTVPDFKKVVLGSPQTLLVTATDPDLDALTISFENLPAFAAVSDPGAGQKQLTFTPSTGQQGTYTFKAKVSDGFNQVVSKEITIVVNNGENLPPRFEYFDDYQIRYGTSHKVVFKATDPEGDAITFSFPTLHYTYFMSPGNSSPDQAEVLVGYTTIADQGSYGIEAVATDAHGASSTYYHNLIIASAYPPVISPVNDMCIQNGQTGVMFLSATNPNNWGQPDWYILSGPPFVSITGGGENGGGVLTVTPGMTNTGRYEVKVGVYSGSVATTKFYITVGGTAITDRTLAPFMTLYEYDTRGQLVKTKTPDGGITEYVYRNDGKLRFSQNAEQRKTGRYSFTNYDAIGRPVQSGEYQPAGGQPFTSDMSVSSGMKTMLENTTLHGGLGSGTKTDVIITQYDLPDNAHGVTGYVQSMEFLPGAVSRVSKYSSIVNNVVNSTNLMSATWFNYNAEGMVLWQVKYVKGLNYKTVDFTYDGLSRLTKRIYQKNTPTQTFVHFYEYDPATQQLWRVYTNTSSDELTRKLQATYVYYLHGTLKRVELAGNLQGIDYTYTLHGNLKSINNSNKTKDPGGDGPSNGFSPDAFGMVLDYHADDYTNGRAAAQPLHGVNTTGLATDSYGGNIKAMTWYSQKPTGTPGMPAAGDPTTYVYKYDENYQLTESTWGTNINFPFSGTAPATFTATAFNKESIKDPATGLPGYDANGNIQYLQRTDGTGLLADKFAYNYQSNTNRLLSVTNEATGSAQLHAVYEYDAVGQLSAETGGAGTKKYLKYDVSGKVILVARDAAFTQKVVEFVYDEFGNRVIKRTYNASSQQVQNTYYSEGVVYTQTVVNGSGLSIVMVECAVDGGSNRIGTFYKVENVYAYELNDHLGNVRAVVAQSGSGLDVRMYTDYYPYGMVLRRYGSGYRYDYQGQYAEKDGETDWNAFELRMYDSRIARWLQYDPKGEFWSPYVGMGNDPIGKSDPDGGSTSPIFDIETGDYLGTDSEGFKGELLFMSKDNFNRMSDNGKKTIDHSVALMSAARLGDMTMQLNSPFTRFLPFEQKTAKVLSNAYTYITNRLSAEGINTNDLHNSKIATYGAQGFYNQYNELEWFVIGSNGGVLNQDHLANALATYDSEKKNITFNLNYMTVLNTVENIQNILVHEYKGHKTNGFDPAVGRHRLAYELQMKHHTYNGTSAAYKSLIQTGYNLARRDDSLFNAINRR